MRLVLASKKNAAIYAHWIEACGASNMPKRVDIDPSRIKRALPYVYIAQVMRDEDGVWFRFRLMGTKLVETLKQEGTGRLLLDLQIGGWEVEWRKNLLQVAKSFLPVVDESTITTGTGAKLEIEHLALPLSEDGLTVDRVLGAIDLQDMGGMTLSDVLPSLNWNAISTIELEKRIIIASLRIRH